MFSLILLLPITGACAIAFARAPAQASSFAGDTLTFAFPPPNPTPAVSDTVDFPNASEVGNAGPTPTGDEAEAIQTAPSIAVVDTFFPLVESETADNQSDFKIIDHWGSLSPWQSIDSAAFGLPGASPVIPDGCTIQQVHLLHRHGGRYPSDGGAPQALAQRVNQAAAVGFSATGPLEFLNTWELKLGEEILTPFGREQMFDLGVGHRVKYGELLKGFDNLPVWRTTSEARMVDSALHFAAGFFGVQQYQSDYHQLIEIENDGTNSTLVPQFACPNTGSDNANLGGNFADDWQSIYFNDTIDRLGAFLPGFNLTIEDLSNMQETCIYETIALGYSAFCGLFTEDEWKGWNYALDLEFWYSFGPGQPTTAAVGLGYMQEYISRITNSRITAFDSSVNATIVSSDILFPLSAQQPIFVRWSLLMILP